MKSFPDFMKSELNKIDQSQQNTKDIEGYYYILCILSSNFFC